MLFVIIKYKTLYSLFFNFFFLFINLILFHDKTMDDFKLPLSVKFLTPNFRDELLTSNSPKKNVVNGQRTGMKYLRQVSECKKVKSRAPREGQGHRLLRPHVRDS